MPGSLAVVGYRRQLHGQSADGADAQSPSNSVRGAKGRKVSAVMAGEIEERTVRDALSRRLKRRNVEHSEGSISVQVLGQRGTLPRRYIVVIGYPKAKVALSQELDRVTGDNQADSNMGVWVLTESQALALCEERI
jgi:hypothetical protein